MKRSCKRPVMSLSVPKTDVPFPLAAIAFGTSTEYRRNMNTVARIPRPALRNADHPAYRKI
jgi:hypothetical protein